MVDLHIHILPGVDDGSRDYADSIHMAAIALDCGVDTIVATPHANQMGRFENFWSDAMHERFQKLRAIIREEQLPLRILTGMEIMASNDMKEKVRDGRLIGLNHTDRYLVEFPFDAPAEWIRLRLRDLLELGKTPLVAHVERYYCVQDDPLLVAGWLMMGCFTQINKGSIDGRFGTHAKDAAMFVLEHDLVTCVASDAHRPYIRTPWMGETQEFLARRYGEEHMLDLCERNPRRIITGKKVPRHGMPERFSDDF